ncbi:enolase-phosphatase E1-like protein [Paraphysoderma sedebokerense]|nr:enolase-phosphatase E1-like protein [Paraphysoderma sedebokerense]
MLPYTTVVSDIEGTTTSISFVKDVLFPYVTDNVDEFLKTNFEDKKVQELIQDLKKQSQTDASEELDNFAPILDDESDQDKFIESIVNNIRWQMKHDRKVTALKAFQGYMWKTAYEKGEVQGEIYDDVLPAFEKWTESHIPIYIYSSGSVSAQKLLFGYTKHGDLCKYFKGHFDTTIGSKLQPASYIDIAKKVGKEPKEILFLSDNVKELQAAKTAGYQVRLAIRPGNAKVTEENLKLYRPFESFSTLF